MNNFKLILGILVLIIVSSTIIYYRSQTLYYKSVYEEKQKEYTEYVATQKIEYEKLQNKYNEDTLKYRTQIIKAEENARLRKVSLDTTIVTNNNLLNSLRQQISDRDVKLSTLTREHLITLSNTRGRYLQDCATEVTRMGGIASQQIINVKYLLEREQARQEIIDTYKKESDNNN